MTIQQERPLSAIRPDPRNTELFDDLSGDEYEALVESIENFDLINPITITAQGLIICGHQRYRALLAAGKTHVMVTVRGDITDDDVEVIDALRIEEQFRRRIVSPGKTAQVVIDWYNRYGVRHGKHDSDSARNLLFDITNITLKQQSQYYTIAAKLIPPLMKLFDEEQISRTTAYQLAQMSRDDQQSLVDRLGDAITEISNKRVAAYRQQIESMEKQAKAQTEAAKKKEEEAEAAPQSLPEKDEPSMVSAEEVVRLEAQHREAMRALAANKDAALGALSREIQGLKANVATKDRAALWERADVVHKAIKQAFGVTMTEPESWLDEMWGKPEIALVLQADIEAAEAIKHWFDRFLAAAAAKKESPDTLRRVK